MICCDWRFRGLIYCTIICAIQPAGRIISESINVMKRRALIHKEVGDIYENCCLLRENEILVRYVSLFIKS